MYACPNLCQNSSNLTGTSTTDIYIQNDMSSRNVFVVTTNAALIEGLSSLCPVPVGSVQEIGTASQPQAIVFDDQLNCTPTVVKYARQTYPTAFIAVYAPRAMDQPHYRQQVFDLDVNQLAYSVQSIQTTILEDVINNRSNQGRITCPFCGLANLTEDELWRHVPAFHINWPYDRPTPSDLCPICQVSVRNTPLQVHIHEKHGPIRRTMSKEMVREARMPNLLYNFALVVCRHPQTGKYLLCQEYSNRGFWLPGGKVDPGEGLRTAALRETMEEAGMKVDLKGLLAVEYHPCGREQDEDTYVVRMRVIFYAEPATDWLQRPPKCRPDFESVGASWCSAADICGANSVRLRGGEPRHWVTYLEGGGAIHQLSILQEREC